MASATRVLYRRSVLIHSVYFWFKPDAAPARVAEFEAGLRSLTGVEHIRQAYFGRPAQTPARPVIDGSFDWALLLHFDDVAAHDAYQAHPLHDEFLERFAALWARVQVYDAQV